MKWISISLTIVVVLVAGWFISILITPPSDDVVFRAEMSLRDGVPFELQPMVDWQRRRGHEIKMSLTKEEKTCLDKQIDFCDHTYIYMPGSELEELKRQAYKAGLPYEEWRRRLISKVAADKCSGLGRELPNK